MARKKRTHRPSDPAEIARLAYERRRNPSAWGTNDEALKLEQNSDVRSEAETRTKVRRVQRFDWCGLLKSRKTLTEDHEAAVRRLETLIAIRFGVEGKPEQVKVDVEGSAEGTSGRMIDAAEQIECALALTGAMSGRLLLALCEPAVQSGQPVNNWRSVVQRVTGEPYEHGQVAVVRAACQNLVEAWGVLDNQPRRAAA